MCTIKAAGGLGFKKLKNFNLEMLAKQGWKLLNNDNMLVTACMKAKYFLGGDFLTADLGTNPSYIWHNIWATRELIKKGCCRKIGNGNDTNI